MGESYIDIPGPLAAPGTYNVSLAKRVNGQLTALGDTQTFEVIQMREPGLKGASPEQVVAFTRELDDLNRQVQGAASAIKSSLTETGAIKQTLLRSDAAISLRDSVRALELELMGMQDRINGNVARDLYGDPGPVSISQRLSAVMMGHFPFQLRPDANPYPFTGNRGVGFQRSKSQAAGDPRYRVAGLCADSSTKPVFPGHPDVACREGTSTPSS